MDSELWEKSNQSRLSRRKKPQALPVAFFFFIKYCENVVGLIYFRNFVYVTPKQAAYETSMNSHLLYNRRIKRPFYESCEVVMRQFGKLYNAPAKVFLYP